MYLVIDGLDDCNITEPGLSPPLKFIRTSSEEQVKVKWLVSSRYEKCINNIVEESNTLSICREIILDLENNARNSTEPLPVAFKRLGLFYDGRWIMWKNEKVLLLPRHIMPRRKLVSLSDDTVEMLVHGSRIAFECYSDLTIVLHFQLPSLGHDEVLPPSLA